MDKETRIYQLNNKKEEAHKKSGFLKKYSKVSYVEAIACFLGAFVGTCVFKNPNVGYGMILGAGILATKGFVSGASSDILESQAEQTEGLMQKEIDSIEKFEENYDNHLKNHPFVENNLEEIKLEEIDEEFLNN